MGSNSPFPRKSKRQRSDSNSELFDNEDDTEDYDDSDDEWTESSTTEWTDYDDSKEFEDPKSWTRRERKAQRKATRDKARFANLTKGEINRVEEVLHPNDPRSDRNANPLDSNAIKANIAFNPSTFKYENLRTDVHDKKMLRNNISPKAIDREKKQTQDAEITIFIQKLGIERADVKIGAKERRNLIRKLRESIKRDLECVANETQQRMMRMAGYWRYANRRTYNHMVEQNQIWDWETGAKLDVIAEEDEVIGEDNSYMSSDPPDESPDRYHYPDEAFAGLSIAAATQAVCPSNTPANQHTPPNSSAEDVKTQSAFAGKKDKRHLGTPGSPITPPKEENLNSFDDSDHLEEKLKTIADDVAAAEDEELQIGKNVLQSPLRLKVNRIAVKGSLATKPAVDGNNRFAPLAVYQPARLRSPESPPSNTISRRSSVRRVANSPTPAKANHPSPLRGESHASIQAQSRSAFPELPAVAKAAKPKVKVAHPPANLSPIQAAEYGNRLARQGRGGRNTTARGGHSGGAGRGGHAVPISYAGILRAKLSGN